MSEKFHRCDVITDFSEWYERRYVREHAPLASYALDKCEETFRRCAWDSFAYWHAIYVRERRKAPNFTASHVNTKSYRDETGSSGNRQGGGLLDT